MHWGVGFYHTEHSKVILVAAVEHQENGFGCGAPKGFECFGKLWMALSGCAAFATLNFIAQLRIK